MFETARSFRRECSPADHAQQLLDQIAADELNAFISVDEQAVLREAEEAARDIARGRDDILLGLPVAVKDNICTRGLKTTCASSLLSDFVPTFDAAVITRLRDSGAVILGKTNMDEFAMGSATDTGCFGPVLNPWDVTRTAGGSSGGSAAAVAAGMCAGALGSDTGGSVRQPAAFCGICGLKPTYGSVSRYGLVAFASSLDQIGPLARTVQDVAVLYEAIRGHDPRDATSVSREYGRIPLESLDLTGLRIGVPRCYFDEGLDEDVDRAVRYAVDVYAELGAEVVELAMPHLKYAVAVYYILATAEASSNLARYDGVRYGLRAPDAQAIDELYRETRARGFGEEVKRRIMLGTYALSAGYAERYYQTAARVRTLITRDFEQAFGECDLIVGPTTPRTAFRFEEMADDVLGLYLQDIYTVPANLAGLPALSIPCGFCEHGMPVGLQLMAPAWREDRLLGAGMAFQEVTRFHQVKP